MTSIRKPASALCLALCCSAYSNAQDSVTDNLVQSNSWQGCYTQTPTAIWGGTSGGPCPNVSLDGGINFSWQPYTLSQNIAINQALAAAGTGIQITGYTYSWWTKNSNLNGQQPGLYDGYSQIMVDLLGPNGQILESDFYHYGYYIPNWTQFSGVRTYSSPYSLTTADTLRLSVSGWDDGYWAGYYGPEYAGFDLRLNYSVDPCASDPLYSPTCSGYAQAMLARLASSMPTSDTAANTVSTDPIADTVPEPATSTESMAIVTPAESMATESMAERESRDADPRALSLARDAQARAAATVASVMQQSQEQSQSAAATQDLARDAAMATSESAQTSDAALGTGLLVGSMPTAGGVTDNNDIGAARPGDPLSEARMPAPVTQSPETNTASGSLQTRREPPAELAGGADFNQFAAVPPDFAAYTALALRDGNMYQPREIYPAQQNTDNRRALRGLGSDALHREMVNQQYGR